MPKRNIKVKPKKNDINTTMFLSIYESLSLNIYKDCDGFYNVILDIVPNKDNQSQFWNDFNKVVVEEPINLDNLNRIVEDILLHFKNDELPYEKQATNIIRAVINNNLDKIKNELRSLLLEVAQGCNFCLEFSELEVREDSSGGISIWMEDNKLHAQDYFEGVYDINYCPMCGRKLR